LTRGLHLKEERSDATEKELVSVYRKKKENWDDVLGQ